MQDGGGKRRGHTRASERSLSLAASGRAAFAPALRVPDVPRPRETFHRRAASSSKAHAARLLPPIGIAPAEGGGSQPSSGCCSLESTDSSTALAEAAAALSPTSLRAQHVAVQRDNRRLRAELARLRGQTGQAEAKADGAAVAAPPCFIYLYASPLCVVAGHNRTKLLQHLDAEKEAERMQRALGSSYPVQSEVATARSLCRAALRKGVWLHVCAHSVELAPGQWYAMLEDQGVRPIASKFCATDLEELFQANGKADGTFVFLAMCHSSKYREAFRRAGFRNVVDCETEVQDKQASEFAHDLYAALADGHNLRSAFGMARTCARARGDAAGYHLEGDGLVQLPPAAAWPRAAGASLSLSRELSGSSAAPMAPREAMPREAEDFVGRVPQMCEVLMALERRLVVVLHCVASNGRTATLRQIGQYANRKGRHFAGRCVFFPAQAPVGGLLIVDDADEVLATGRRHELLAYLQLHREARLLLACREACYDDFIDCGIKPYNVALPPLHDQEAAELFLMSARRPLTAADLSLCSALDGGASPDRIVQKAEAQKCLKESIGVLAGEPGRVRKAGSLVRPGSPPLDLPRLKPG